MIRIITITCCLLMALASSAQKKELNEAEGYLKSGKNLDKAEKLMTDLLKNPKHRHNKKVYLMWYRSLTAQYDAANEKLYLKEKYDTAKFFNLVQRMYEVAETLDSIDARPDHKGRVRPDYRRRHAEQLDAIRRNLYYGGTYQLNKQHYDEAYGYFHTYLDTDHQPLFKGYGYLASDTLMPQAAFWATQCGYLLQRPDTVLHYHEQALLDTPRRHFTLQYVCEAYRWLKSDSGYVATLRQGVAEYPEHPYFFPRLADWYTAHCMPDSVLHLADQVLKVNPDNQLFLLAKSVAQLNTSDDAGCIATSERLIALNDTLPEPYYNIATVRLNQAFSLEIENEPRKNRARLQELYSQARPYMETYRRLAPDQRRRWAPGLYRIYFNLNMGREFEEIDKILNK